MSNNNTRRSDDRSAKLAGEPRDFFMTLRDVAFWIRSVRADAALAQLQTTATAGEAFDRLYRSIDDPYGTALPQFRYQRRKYRGLLSILPRRPYGDVLDMGCGLGVFSRALAPHADRVLGIDVSLRAVSQARSLSTGFGNLHFEQGDIHSFDSPRRFSLIVLADVVYYLLPLTDVSVQTIAAKLTALLEPGGLLLLVNHFFFAVDRRSRVTRRIHNVFRASSDLAVVAEHRRAFYLATVLERR